jgi:hypothetical protein
LSKVIRPCAASAPDRVNVADALREVRMALSKLTWLPVKDFIAAVA